MAVVGAAGFAGAEVLRLVLAHPHLQVGGLFGRSSAGKPAAELLPHLGPQLAGMVIQACDAAQVAGCAEVACVALPHGHSAAVSHALRQQGLIVCDLSADFRLRDAQSYRDWYGAHAAPERLGEAVYGLAELYADAIRRADLIAVPGCYPTASILALAPLLQHHAAAIQAPIIIDAKSGVSGAGRSLSETTHFTFATDGVRAYKSAGRHRHTPEIEQSLSELAGRPVQLTFTPHLVPMRRGILATAYAYCPELTLTEVIEAAQALYASSPFVQLLPPGAHPDTAHLRGSNRVHVAYGRDGRTGMILAQAAIDNLVKGAAGQAIQCLNLRFGWPEDCGLQQSGLWP
ncbi:MAG: N-acetyl-gamma-glutamyl-phosphate reductase [Polyangiales bacterium]